MNTKKKISFILITLIFGLSTAFVALAWTNPTCNPGTSPTCSGGLNAVSGAVGIASTTPWGMLSITNTGANPGLIIEDSTSPDTTPFIVDASGNVGIGTTNPGAPLDIQSALAALKLVSTQGVNRALTIYQNNGGTYYVGIDNYTGGLIAAGSAPYAMVMSSDGAYPVQFGTNSTIRTTIDSSGKVGIASTTPWGLLSVNPNGITGPAFVIGSSTATKFIVTNGGNVGVGTASVDTSYKITTTAGGIKAESTTQPAGYFNSSSGYGLIVNTGNVGIGTVSPGINLQVRSDSLGTWGGRMGLANATADKEIFFGTYGSIGGVFAHNNALNAWADLYINTVSGTTGMVVKGDGNVGIGTTNPGAKLEVESDTSAGLSNNLILSNLATGNVANAAGLVFTLKSSAGTTYNFGRITVASNDITSPSEDGTMGFDVMTAGTVNQRVVTLRDGNVGIGTIVPTHKLQLQSSADESIGILVNSGNAGTISYSYLALANSNGASWLYNFGPGTTFAGTVPRYIQDSVLLDGGGVGGLSLAASHASGVMRFYTNADNERMRITSAGNVGIGTTTPAQKLSVEGIIYSGTGGFKFPDGTTQTTAAGSNALAQGNTFVGNASNIAVATSTIYMHSASVVGIGTNFGIGDIDSTYNLTTKAGKGGIKSVNNITATPAGYFSNSAGPGLIVDTGNVGIGTTEPLSKLHVFGSGSEAFARFDNSNAADYGLIKFTENGTGKGYLGMGGSTQGFGANAAYAPDGFSIVSDGVGVMNIANRGTSKTIYLDTGTEGGADFHTVTVKSGNVGIGTTGPGVTLDVVGGGGSYGAYNTPLRVKGTSYTYAEILGTGSQAGIVYNRDGSTGWLTGLNGAGSFRIADLATIDQTGLTNAKDGTEGITIKADGNVGIGTTGPAVTLDIPAYNTTNSQVRFGSMEFIPYALTNSAITDNAYYNDGYKYRNTGYATDLQINDGSGNLSFRNAPSGTAGAAATMTGRLTILNNGNVGIGTTAPASKLDVVGGVKMANDSATCDASKAGTIRWTGMGFQGCDGSEWISLSASPSCTIFQPSGGLNNGTDEGSASKGKDTYVSSNYAAVNFGSSVEMMFNYYSSYDGWPLLKFDVSTLPSDIASAKLYLYATGNCGGGSCPNMNWTVNAITLTWNEMTATWNVKPTQSGSYGTLNIPVSATGVGQWVSVDITTLYNAWKAGTVTNYGIGFTRLGSTGDGGVWFNHVASSDYSTAASRPKLVITRTAGTCQ